MRGAVGGLIDTMNRTAEALRVATAERDSARTVAVRLEQENAELRARLDAVRALACDVP